MSRITGSIDFVPEHGNITRKGLSDTQIDTLLQRVRSKPSLYSVTTTRGQAIKFTNNKSQHGLFIFQQSAHWRFAADVADGMARFDDRATMDAKLAAMSAAEI